MSRVVLSTPFSLSNFLLMMSTERTSGRFGEGYFLQLARNTSCQLCLCVCEGGLSEESIQTNQTNQTNNIVIHEKEKNEKKTKDET
jgi:hypothetical protein